MIKNYIGNSDMHCKNFSRIAKKMRRCSSRTTYYKIRNKLED